MLQYSTADVGRFAIAAVPHFSNTQSHELEKFQTFKKKGSLKVKIQDVVLQTHKIMYI